MFCKKGQNSKNKLVNVGFCSHLSIFLLLRWLPKDMKHWSEVWWCVQLDEVSALNQSVILLEQKLTEAEAARLDLISNRWENWEKKIGAKLVTQWKNFVGGGALTEILCKFSSFISIICIQELACSQATTWEWFEGEREQHLNRPVQVHDSQVTLCWHGEDCRFVLPPGWTFHSTSDAVSLPSGSLAGGRIWFSSSDRSSYK